MAGVTMTPEPWRLRCPAGHCSWETRVDGYYCEQCDEYFDQLRDAKTGAQKQLIPTK